MRLQKTFRHWLPFAVMTTLFCGITFIAVQQNIRSFAYDPQIQINEAIVDALNKGQPLQAVIPDSRVDIATSLAVYAIAYNEAGEPAVSSAQLNGSIPVPPKGVFQYAQDHGQDRITWQLAANVRDAIVVDKYNGGFVLVGRSLREAEARTIHILKLISWSGLAILIVMFVLSFALTHKISFVWKRKSETEHKGTEHSGHTS